MARYSFKCPLCSYREYSSSRELAYCPSGDGVVMKRDYMDENVGVAVVNLRNERERGGSEGIKRMFLPHNDDFAGPGDPDGTKGMRAWRDEHQPKDSNKSPDWPGFVDKQVM